MLAEAGAKYVIIGHSERRRLFGDTIYRAFRNVKYAFDPENRMNPGKIVAP